MKIIKNTIFLALAFLLISSLLKNIIDYQKKIRFYEDVQKDYQKEKDKNKKLRSDLAKSQDYYTVEKNIRNKLNLLKEGESLLILPKIIPTPTAMPQIKKSIPRQWLDLFFLKD